MLATSHSLYFQVCDPGTLRVTGIRKFLRSSFIVDWKKPAERRYPQFDMLLVRDEG